MRIRAGLPGLALALCLAGGCGTAVAGVLAAAPQGSTPAADTVRLELNPAKPEDLALVRTLTGAPLPDLRFALTYSQPLVQMLTYSQTIWGPDGQLALPGQRRFCARLTFTLAGQSETRELLPPGGNASVTLRLTPPQVRQTWTWPDGLRLEQVCYQPQAGKAAGVHFLLVNQTGQTQTGLRLIAHLQDAELSGRTRRGCQEGDDEIMADPRTEVLYQRDAQVREASWLGAGWGPLGGRIGGAEAVAGRPAPEAAGTELNLETPAWDLAPGQAHEAVFWLVWDYEQVNVSRTLRVLRQQSAFGAWESACRQGADREPRFSCRNESLCYLFQMLKAWAPWLRRQDDYGAVFIGSTADADPASPASVAAGALGYAWLGQGRVLREAFEAWLNQRLEIKDLPSALLAIHRTWLVTRDTRWAREYLPYISEWLDMLAAGDVNGDGLPEYFGSLPPNPERYDPFQNLEGWPDPDVHYLDAALASVQAFRQGAELLQTVGDENDRLLAVRYRLLAEQGEKTLDTRFWLPGLGAKGYYAYAWRLRSGQRAAHRGLAAILAVSEGCGQPAHRAAVFEELWQQPAWRTTTGSYRTLPVTDSDFNGDGDPARGGPSFAQTHAVLLVGLEQKASATQAMERLEHYAESLVLDPASLGWVLPGSGRTNGITPAEYSWVELLVRGLAGLVPTADGLKVNIPLYEQDLGVTFKGLVYGKDVLDVQVIGPGGATEGTIRFDGRLLPNGSIIPNAWMTGRRHKLVIRRQTGDMNVSEPVLSE